MRNACPAAPVTNQQKITPQGHLHGCGCGSSQFGSEAEENCVWLAVIVGESAVTLCAPVTENAVAKNATPAMSAIR